MKKLTAKVRIGDIVKNCDVIEHEGKLWLVPEWLTHQATGEEIPSRIICISVVPHQLNPSALDCDLVVNRPIPPEVLRGEARTDGVHEYQVIENPFGFPDASNDPIE